MEIAMRMQQHGLKIIHAAKAVVYTSSPRTIRKLYKQRVRWV
jgi:cellulose synthase/poly-beta-1,6-N-acetylglucosamine synthase-like glycosyltransferase